MKVLRTVSELGQLPAGCVLSIGNFDGVHIGHQQNLKVARDIALLEGVALAAMTFEPHPVAILHPEKAPGVLTPLPLKIRLLELHRRLPHSPEGHSQFASPVPRRFRRQISPQRRPAQGTSSRAMTSTSAPTAPATSIH